MKKLQIKLRATMTEFSEQQLKHAVESQHGGTATFARSVIVHETHEGQTVWNGAVQVYNLAGHPNATRAYAWSSSIEGSVKRRFFAVLHTGLITGPAEAVRAAIVEEARAGK
jgi:hypothetical protein